MTKYWLGKKRSTKDRKKMSDIAKKTNRKPPSRKGTHISEEHKQKIGLALRGKKRSVEIGRKMGEKTRGENHWNWKGGTSNSINKIIRISIEYKLWRKAVFERDNYTCVWCGFNKGYIEADHIKKFSDYPALRFAIDNGRTLCK